jgi:hypothetical protein
MAEENMSARNSLDEAADVMRQRLRDYMADYGIGAPGLCQRINESLGLDSGAGDGALAPKTLQRFLAGRVIRGEILQSIAACVAGTDRPDNKDG